MSHSKLVGVHTDDGLTWNEYVTHFIKKVLASLKAMRSVRDFVDIPPLVMIYNSLVEPYFEYCSNVWYSGEWFICKTTKASKQSSTNNYLQRLKCYVCEAVKTVKLEDPLSEVHL